MSNSTNVNSGGIYYGPPDDYIEPRWPGLYQPFKSPKYLYNPYAIWRFTLLWTLVLFGVVFALAGFVVIPIFAKRHLRLSLLAPLVFVSFGLLGALISSTIVGYALAALYNAAFLRMSTFVPALWAAIQTLVLLVGALRSGTTGWGR
ncbi:hypothetical protein T439DRAFT_320403 [Meredithblackwellia eburnea MCA 4105]